MVKNIFYISFTRLEYSLNAVCIKGLEQNGITVYGRRLCKRQWKEYFHAWQEYRRIRKNVDLIIAGYDSPGLAILARLFSRKRVVYNAVLSIYERMIVSRAMAARFSIKSFYYWLSDFLAVHLSHLIMLESNSQISYFHQIFGVSKNKCFRAWIGADEDRFFYDPNIAKPTIFTVVFRGGLLPEAGAEYIVKAAKLLENENLKITMHANDQELPKIKKMIEDLKPKNLQLITEFLSDEDLRILMQKSHLSLGQLSAHPRLQRTIPHKCYESLAMKLPYLTAANPGILELLTPEQTCLICDPANAQSLAEKILWAKNNYPFVEKIAENGYELYQNKLRSMVLAKKLLDRVSLS